MAASPRPPGAPGLADLPDDLLVACFERLEDPLERRCVLPFVCSRWRRLADEPHLLGSFSLELLGAAELPRLTAFCRWLEQSGAGAAVRLIDLDVSIAEHEQPLDESCLKQLHIGLLRITAACSGLQELRVAMDLPLPPLEVCSLTGGLPSLRLLHLLLERTAVVINERLGGLSQLQDLRVEGDPLRMHPALALPPSLTRLHLGRFIVAVDEELPPQLANLPQLAHLELYHLGVGPEGFHPLSRLTSLTALGLQMTLELPWPAALRPLTNLRSLQIDAPEDMEQLLEALPQLTALWLNMPRLPLAMAALVGLERFAWTTSRPAGQLPKGPWLNSLRKLMLPSHIAGDNLRVLRQATRLEHLALMEICVRTEEAASTAELLSFVCQHASLHCLQLCGPVGISEADAAVAMQSHARLRVLFTQNYHEPLREVVPEFGTQWFLVPYRPNM